MSLEASDKSVWRPLGRVDLLQLNEARLLAHHAVQWLARAARAYVPPEPDDGHTSLQWQDRLNGFLTHPFGDGGRLGLCISSLTLGLQGGDNPTEVQSLSLNGHSDAQARQWLGEQLGSRGFDPKALDAPSPYEIPPHAIAQGASYDAAGSPAALTELAAWYANADVLLDRVRMNMVGQKLAAMPLCCWPHHFDLATLTMLPTKDPDTAGYIGVGFSPGDEYYDEPYFYVSVYPEPDPVALPTLPEMGHWHTHEFTAGVKLAHTILAGKNMAVETDNFLQRAVGLALRIVSEASR
jgi:hypothetical protein